MLMRFRFYSNGYKKGAKYAPFSVILHEVADKSGCFMLINKNLLSQDLLLKFDIYLYHDVLSI